MENTDLYVKITFRNRDEEYSEIDVQVEELHNRLLKYKCGYGGLILGNYYLIEYESDLFMEIKRLCERYSGKVTATVGYIRTKLDKHYDEYKGFLIEQPIKFVRYNRELFDYPCNECAIEQLKDREFYEVGKVSTRKLKEYDIFQLGDGIEIIYCVTPKLKDELELMAADSIVFKEIRSRGELIAYAMLPKYEHNISCTHWETEKCETCGRVSSYINHDKQWEPETYYLDDEAIKYPFSLSSIYFYGSRKQILISKECYKVFRKYVDERNFVPIF